MSTGAEREMFKNFIGDRSAIYNSFESNDIRFVSGAALINDQPGHDKLYYIVQFARPNISGAEHFFVNSYYGRNGKRLKEVKIIQWADSKEADLAMTKLIDKKVWKGYRIMPAQASALLDFLRGCSSPGYDGAVELVDSLLRSM